MNFRRGIGMSPAKTSNQEQAPVCAAWVEALRAEFGEDQVKVLWVKEGDVELGERDAS